MMITTKSRVEVARLMASCLIAANWIGGTAIATADDDRALVQSQVAAEIQAIQAGKPPSQSIGRLSQGKLLHPAELPKPGGIGYAISHPDRDTNFGADRMVVGLLQIGLAMHERLGAESHHRVVINEISDRDGGKQRRHINHQMGLDVDLCLYVTDRSGTPLNARWVSFDESGLSPKKSLEFDVRRNWILLDAILASESFAPIRAIFLSEPLKNRLLNHAMSLQQDADGSEAERLRRHVEMAMKLVRQPVSSPHDNHFHLSLSK